MLIWCWKYYMFIFAYLYIYSAFLFQIIYKTLHDCFFTTRLYIPYLLHTLCCITSSCSDMYSSISHIIIRWTDRMLPLAITLMLPFKCVTVPVFVSDDISNDVSRKHSSSRGLRNGCLRTPSWAPTEVHVDIVHQLPGVCRQLNPRIFHRLYSTVV